MEKKKTEKYKEIGTVVIVILLKLLANLPGLIWTSSMVIVITFEQSVCLFQKTFHNITFYKLC